MRFLILLTTLLLTIDISAQDYWPDPGWNGNNFPSHDSMPRFIGANSRPRNLAPGLKDKIALGVFDTGRGAIAYPIMATSDMLALSGMPIGAGVFNRDSFSICFYDGADWLCLSKGSGSGGVSPWNEDANSVEAYRRQG